MSVFSTLLPAFLTLFLKLKYYREVLETVYTTSDELIIAEWERDIMRTNKHSVRRHFCLWWLQPLCVSCCGNLLSAILVA